MYCARSESANIGFLRITQITNNEKDIYTWLCSRTFGSLWPK